MHICISAPVKEVNLKTMLDINRKFDVIVGYSDHTEQNYTAIHAASIGQA